MHKVAVARETRFYVSVLAVVLFLNMTFVSLAQETNMADSKETDETVMVKPQAAERTMLDGKTFVGEIGKEGQEKGDPDTFIFTDGKFRSTACDAYGFTATEYNATNAEDTIKFEAKATSPTDGTMDWQGTVQGETLEGRAVWYKEGQEPIVHWVKAKTDQ